MVKFVIAAVWIAAVSIGSVFYSFHAAQGKADLAVEKPAFGGLDYVNTDIISVPLMKEGVVYGYFLTRLVYVIDPKKLATLSLPVPALLVDAVYSWLYGNPLIDFSDSENLDLDALRNGLRDGINARVGDKLIHEILVEQIDFLAKSEIRNNTLRRNLASNPTKTKIIEDE